MTAVTKITASPLAVTASPQVSPILTPEIINDSGHVTHVTVLPRPFDERNQVAKTPGNMVTRVTALKSLRIFGGKIGDASGTGAVTL